jgi:hypothetical protein
MTAIEFVRDKRTKEPFPRSAKVTEKVIDNLDYFGVLKKGGARLCLGPGGRAKPAESIG